MQTTNQIGFESGTRAQTFGIRTGDASLLDSNMESETNYFGFDHRTEAPNSI